MILIRTYSFPRRNPNLELILFSLLFVVKNIDLVVYECNFLFNIRDALM